MIFNIGNIKMDTDVIVGAMLERKAETYCDKNEFEYEYMQSPSEFKPTQDDIPSIVESIKFWSTICPPGVTDDWNDTKCRIYLEAKKKETILLEMLGGIEGMDEYAYDVAKTNRREVLKKRLREKIRN